MYVKTGYSWLKSNISAEFRQAVGVHVIGPILNSLLIDQNDKRGLSSWINRSRPLTKKTIL